MMSVRYRLENKSFFVTIALVLSIVLGLFVPRAPIVVWGFMAIGVLLILVFQKLDMLVFIWLFSSVFSLYRLDVGPVTLNLYRVGFLLVFAAAVFRPSYFMISRTGISRWYLAFLGILFVFTLGWARSENRFHSVVVSDLLLIYFWLAMVFYLLHFASNGKRFGILINSYLCISSFTALYGIYESLSWLITGTTPPLPLANSGLLETRLAYETAWKTVGGVPRSSSFFNDSNSFAIYLVMAISILLFYLSRRSLSRKQRAFYAFLVIVHLIAVMFTVSRSGVILLGILLGLVWLKVVQGQRIQIIGLVMVALVLAIGLYFVFPSVLSEGIDALTGAFSLRGLTPGEGRITFVTLGIGNFLKNPLVGAGVADVWYKERAISDTAHSFYVTILGRYGLFGAGVVAFFLFPVFRKVVKVLIQPKPDMFDLCFAIAAMVLLTFQFVYDNLLGEFMALPFSMFCAWALTKRENQCSASRF